MIDTFLRAICRAQRADLQRFGTRVVTDVAEADEWISLEDARDHLRVDTYGSPPVSDDDAWITAQIPAAREYCERDLGRALAPRTLEIATNAFPSVTVDPAAGPAFPLPFGPVTSIVSAKYDDSDGVEQTVDPATYVLDPYAHPSRLCLAYGQTWPTARASHNSVRVRYVTGYERAAGSPPVPVVPNTARAAMLLMLGHLYENREATGVDKLIELPLGVRALLEMTPNRERMGFA